MILSTESLPSKPPDQLPPALGRIISGIVWSIMGVLTVITAFQMRDRVVRNSLHHPRVDVNDFDRWMHMFPGFLLHHANFVNDLWPMPPSTLYLLSPLALFTPANAQFIWICCKPLMVAAIFYMVMAMVRRAGVRLPAAAIALLAAIWFWPIIGDMQEGQMNLFMLTPMVAGLFFAQLERPSTDWLAGLLIGLAVCIKVTPIIFLIYMLWRRRWRVALAIVLGTLFWIFPVGAMAFGWHQNLIWWKEWTHIMITPYVLKGAVSVYSGESIPSFLYRLLTHVPAFKTSHLGGQKSWYVNVVNLRPDTARLVVRVVLVMIGATGLLWMYRRLPTLRCRRYIMEIGAVAAFMLWAEEWCWVPHYVTLVLTIAAAAMIAVDAESSRRAAKRAWLALGIAAVLMLFTSDAVKIFGPHAANWGRTVDPSLFAGMGLVLVIIFAGYSRSTAYGPAVDAPTAAADIKSARQ